MLLGKARPTALSTRPTALSTRPPALSTRPTALSTRPTALSTRPTALSARPVALSTRPTALSTRPTALSARPTAVSTRTPPETLRSQLCAAPERDLRVLTFPLRGLSDPSHHSPEDRQMGPPPRYRPSRLRAPSAPSRAMGPRCALGGADRRWPGRSAVSADGRAEARCPQMAGPKRGACRWAKEA